MAIQVKQIGVVEPIADLATGGAISLAVASRIEQVRAVTINQTTASQTITLPAPVDASVVFSLDVHNIGSAEFSLYGVSLAAGQMARYGWNGSAWAPDAAPTSVGATRETLVPTAQNTVPNLAAAPLSGSLVKVYCNGVHVVSGIAVSAAGAVTVTPATLGFNVETTDEIVVEYFV